MRSILKNISVIALAAMLLIGLVPTNAFAAEQSVTITRDGGFNISQDGKAYMNVTANAANDTAYVLTAISDGDIDIVTGSSGAISAAGNTTVTFQFYALKSAKEGDHQITIYATDPEDKNKVYGKRSFSITVNESLNSYSSMEGVAADIDYLVDGGETLVAGQTNRLRLYLFNRGSQTIRNTKVQIVLPEGISIKSGSDTVNLGYFDTGNTITADFELVSRDDISSGSIPIDVNISGIKFNGGDVVTYSGKIYIPVSGKGGSSAADLEIVSVSVPEKVNADGEFTLSFSVRNNGSAELKDLTATVEVPAGISNLTKSIFNIKTIAAGATQSFSLKCKAGSEGGSKNFRISVAPSSGSGSSVSDYAVVTVNGNDGDGSSKPILMVSDYSYGGGSVQAGSEFDFSITFLNTSKTGIRNIKATIGSQVFIPVGSSSSIYIASIPAGGSVTKTVRMSCLDGAEQGPSSVSVAMEYEGGENGSFSSSDTISVPVIQETRFVVDEILDPGYLTAADQAYITVNYYNMGKQQLSNLRISAEGDFTVDGNASVFIGNMASGRSDYYNLRFFPNGEGPCNGTVTFTFEDAAGEEQVVKKEFTFNIQPAPTFEDPGMEMPVDPAGQGLPGWTKIAIGVAAVGALIVIVKMLKAHRKKKNEALELEDE